MSPSQEEFPSELEISFDAEAIDYELEYETPAPYSIETPTPKGKRIKVIGPEDIHYENIIASTDLPQESQESKIDYTEQLME